MEEEVVVVEEVMVGEGGGEGGRSGVGVDGEG